MLIVKYKCIVINNHNHHCHHLHPYHYYTDRIIFIVANIIIMIISNIIIITIVVTLGGSSYHPVQNRMRPASGPHVAEAATGGKFFL